MIEFLRLNCRSSLTKDYILFNYILYILLLYILLLYILLLFILLSFILFKFIILPLGKQWISIYPSLPLSRCLLSRLAPRRAAVAAPYNQAQAYLDLAMLQVCESNGLGGKSPTTGGSPMLAISSSQMFRKHLYLPHNLTFF